MTMDASFLLLSCAIHKNIDVADQLRKLNGVREALPVYGTYDCIVKTEKMSYEDINNLVSSSIRPLENVSSVLVLYSETPPKLLDRSYS